MNSANPLDTRKYEQSTHDTQAANFDRINGPEFQWKHKYFTAPYWAKVCPGLFLDYGCGTGVISQVLSAMGCHVIAFDISPNMVALAREKTKVPVLIADGLNLPFKDQAFSTICINGVLHHILDLDRAVDEICRCTKNAICLHEASTTSPCFPIDIILRLNRRLVSIDRFNKSRFTCLFRKVTNRNFVMGSEHERPLDPNQLVRLLKGHGFEVVKIRFHTHIPYIHLFLPERIRKYIHGALISSTKGNSVEIIALKVSGDDWEMPDESSIVADDLDICME